MHISILTPAFMGNSLRKKVTERLLARYPEADILYPIDEDTSNGTRLYLLVVAETSYGYRIGQGCLWGRKLNPATSDSVTAIVIKALERELDAGGCVDEYMQDQLVVFQALAEGRSTVGTGKKARATLHTQTASWVVRQVLVLTFDEQGNCNGCGFEVGEDCAERKVEDAVADLEKVRIESNADKRLE
ncbi:MAG: hypothetical protein Q9173_001244 [Seirophora scorigena]